MSPLEDSAVMDLNNFHVINCHVMICQVMITSPDSQSRILRIKVWQ